MCIRKNVYQKKGVSEKIVWVLNLLLLFFELERGVGPNQNSTECIWCQQKQSMMDRQKDDWQSDPYVALSSLAT